MDFDRGVVSEENLVAIRKRADSIWGTRAASSAVFRTGIAQG